MSRKRLNKRTRENYNFKKEKVYREKYKELFYKSSDNNYKSKKKDGKEKINKDSYKKDENIKKISDENSCYEKTKKNEKFKDNKILAKDEVKKISNNKKRKVLFIILLLIVLIVLGYFCYKTYVRGEISKKVNDNINIEYGEKITEKYILKDDFEKVSFSPKLSSLKEVGEHEVTLTINGYEFKVVINIKDTTPPVLEVQDVQRYLDEELPEAKDFVVKVEDLSDVDLKISEIKSQAGEQEVEVMATDKYGNKTSKKTKINIIEYKGSVKINGLTNLTVYVGNKADLKKNVSAVDDRFGQLEFTVDDSKVNYNKPGTYKIYYTAKDKLGNVTTRERKITVKEKTVMINNFPTYSQFPNYPNGCETIALYLMLKYYGVNVSPATLVNNLAKGDGPYWENDKLYGGNPEVEFVGDPRDKHGYGCYQRPIINLASKYKSGMVDYTGHSLNQVLELVRSGKPVQVWVSINLKNTSVCATWYNKASGKNINWICNLHSVVIVGFNDNYVYVSDPYTRSIEKYKRTQFHKMYNLFGKRALYFR